MNLTSSPARLARTRVAGVIAIAAAAAIALSSCATNESPPAAGSATALAGTLNGSGASSQGSASDAWIAAFQTAHPDVTVNYSPDGSGAGRKAFIAGGVQYAGSDSALSDEELAGTFAACAPDSAAIDLPVYVSPIAVIFNVAGVKKLNLDAATIAGIFKGAITTWNDPAIAALNPGAALPSADITAVHRSDDSGTTKNFADYLHQVAPRGLGREARRHLPLYRRRGGAGHLGRGRRGDRRRQHDRLRGCLPRRNARRRGAEGGRLVRGVQRESCRGRRRRIAAGHRPGGERHRDHPRSEDHRRVALPARAGELPDRLPAVSGCRPPRSW